MCHCNQCGYNWKPRPETNGNPRACPSCKRYDWQEPKKGIRDGQSRNGDQGSGDHRRDSAVRGHQSDSDQGAGEVRVATQEPSDRGSSGEPEHRSDDRAGIAIYPRPEEVIAQFEEDIDEPDKTLCGFESWNELDGENYRCMLPVHGPKVKHGCWRKI